MQAEWDAMRAGAAPQKDIGCLVGTPQTRRAIASGVWG